MISRNGMKIINKLLMGLLLISSIEGNELVFKEIKDVGDNSIRITFKLDKVSYLNSYALNNPSRIVIEVNQSELKNIIDEPYNYPIKKVRASSKGDVSTIVIDLYESVYWKKPWQVQTKDGVLVNLEIKKDRNIKQNIRDIIVAIDAGHGGKDPGAVSKNNLLEKDITLLIARELERTLRDTKGYRPVMIRKDDSFIDLNDRYQDARKVGADIFVSIHADAFRLASVKGASVFIWSEEASSITAKNLSKKELKNNPSIKSKIGKLDVDDFDEDAARTLYQLVYEAKIKNLSLIHI